MTAPDEIVVSALPGDRRAAWLDRGRLVRFFTDGPEGRIGCGDIVLGRVTALAPPLGLAFVDIGPGEPPGTVTIGAGAATPARPAEGDRLLVQVARTAIDAKGAKLSRQLSLRGRLLILQPDGGAVATARGVAADDGQRLVARAAALLPAGHGGQLRAAALAAADAAISAEAAALVACWQAIAHAAAAARPPKRLYRAPAPLVVAVRDGLGPRLARIRIDHPGIAAELRQLLPAAAPLLRVERGGVPLFEAAGVSEQLEAALSPELALAGGGRVHIAETPALVAIDVDAGASRSGDARATSLAVNREAAAAIAEAIVLRELAGTIVIDFVAMRARGTRAGVAEALSAGLADDERQTDIAGFTALGLFALRRAREGPSLRARLTQACPACAGTARVPAALVAAGDGLRALVAAADAAPHRSHLLIGAADVMAAWHGPLAAAVRDCGVRLGREVALAADSRLPPGCYRLEARADIC